MKHAAQLEGLLFPWGPDPLTSCPLPPLPPPPSPQEALESITEELEQTVVDKEDQLRGLEVAQQELHERMAT